MIIRRAALFLLLAFALASLTSAQSYPPAWSSSASYAIGDQVQLNGNVLRATHAVTPGGFKYDEWELWEVRANTTLMVGVGQTFTSLVTAWNYAHNARIADVAFLHFYISSVHGPFIQNFAAPFSLNQACGASISILGDNASKVQLGFGSSSAFTIDSGHKFGTLSNLAIEGVLDDAPRYGIFATDASSIVAVAGCPISGYDIGVESDNNSTINLTTASSITGCKVAACQAYLGGAINFTTGWTLDGSYGAALVGQNGVLANYGGKIVASSCLIQNVEFGAQAANEGVIDVDSATIKNTNYGIYCYPRGYAHAYSTKISQSLIEDIYCIDGSAVFAGGASYTTIEQNGSLDGSYIYTS